MKPLFTFVVPAYNGEPFLDTSIHSLVSQRLIEEKLVDLYEIIIVNDGSKDNTEAKAAELAKKWNKTIRKDFIRVINKPNGQYGSVINRGVQEAKGTYFKVLDCDDTFNTASLIKLIYLTLGLEKTVDVIFTDHTFEKVGVDKQVLLSLRKWFEPYKIINLQKQKFPSDLITMHSIIYRTDLLREINYKQVEGVYYSDSQYSLIPLSKAQTMYYAELPLYRYYIGRAEQSINLKVMVRNRMHQIVVFERIFKEMDFNSIFSKSVKEYSLVVMRRMIQWQAMILVFDKSVKPKDKSKEMVYLFQVVRNLQPEYANQILKGAFFWVVRITHGRFIAPIMKFGIKIYSKFNKNIMAEWD